MKIVCESCGAKYSIADERVSGKMFKIRCKRCSEVIVVRGDQQAQPAAEPVLAPAQDSIWHVVVEGEQAGPYSPSQLGEMLTSGAVDWDAYVWTEGFDNWAPMRDVEDLVAKITGQAQPQAAAQAAAPAYRPTTQTLTGQPSMGADPFADDAAPSDGGMFGGSAGGAGPDLFARGAAPAAGGFGARAESGVLASSPSPRMAAERVLTGARNENSVLFSLKNLQALATGSGTTSPPVAASFGGADRGGFAGGEGSGLIDIRALATTTASSDTGAGGGHKDELLSIGSQGGAFGTLGSPMLTSMGEDGDGNKKTVIWAVVAGLGLVSAALVSAAYILRAPAQVAPSVTVGPAPSAQGALVPAPTPSAVPTQAAVVAAAPSEGELAAKRAAEQDKGNESDKGSSSSHSSGEHHHKHGTDAIGSKSAAGESDPTAMPEPKKSPAKSGPRSIDELLDGALSGSSSAKGAHGAADSAAAKSNLPDTPSREQVVSAMNGIKSAVQACAKGSGSVATVTVNVAGATGRVTTAEVNGVTGPPGSCIAQAARKAQFPKFAKSVFKITFPYKL